MARAAPLYYHIGAEPSFCSGRHFWHPIILGISEPSYSDEQLQEFRENSSEMIEIDGKEKTRYEWSQEMRKLETKIREEKEAQYAEKQSNVITKDSATNIKGFLERYDKIASKTGIEPVYTRTKFTSPKAAEKLTNSGKSSIIDIEIDKITPCLIRVSDGKIVETSVSIVHPTRSMTKDWEFDWTRPERDGYTVRALRVKGEREIHGMIATKKEQGYVHVSIVESSPKNNKHNPKFSGEKVYEGIGAHLFAEACRESYESGFSGFVAFEAKSELVDYYKKMLGAEQVGSSRRMFIDDSAAMDLLKNYYPEMFE